MQRHLLRTIYTASKSHQQNLYSTTQRETEALLTLPDETTTEKNGLETLVEKRLRKIVIDLCGASEWHCRSSKCECYVSTPPDSLCLQATVWTWQTLLVTVDRWVWPAARQCLIAMRVVSLGASGEQIGLHSVYKEVQLDVSHNEWDHLLRLLTLVRLQCTHPRMKDSRRSHQSLIIRTRNQTHAKRTGKE